MDAAYGARVASKQAPRARSECDKCDPASHRRQTGIDFTRVSGVVKTRYSRVIRMTG
jgi:hypothetical protein